MDSSSTHPPSKRLLRDIHWALVLVPDAGAGVSGKDRQDSYISFRSRVDTYLVSQHSPPLLMRVRDPTIRVANFTRQTREGEAEGHSAQRTPFRVRLRSAFGMAGIMQVLCSISHGIPHFRGVPVITLWHRIISASRVAELGSTPSASAAT